MHHKPETLGHIIKTARENAGITIEALANKVDITERYLYRIENEGKKPSFDVLHKLVRELNISADSIFYPKKPSKDSEVENSSVCFQLAMNGRWKSLKQLQKP